VVALRFLLISPSPFLKFPARSFAVVETVPAFACERVLTLEIPGVLELLVPAVAVSLTFFVCSATGGGTGFFRCGRTVGGTGFIFTALGVLA
jgi:hypothetical protein